MKKAILIGLAVLIVAVIALGLSLDSIVRREIESRSSKALGVETQLGSASLGLLTGSLELTGFQIGNPAGFDSPNAVDIELVELEMSWGSLFEETIVSRRLLVRGVAVRLEHRGGRTNLAVLHDNLKKNASSESGSKGKKFAIEEVVIENIKAEISLGPLEPLSFDLPPITLKDVGKKGASGINQAQLLQRILDEIARAAQRQRRIPGVVDQLKERFGIGPGR